MKPGDRVTTPAGPATITSVLKRDNWVGNRSHPSVFVIVHADGEPGRRVFPIADVELQESELIEWPAP